MTEREVPVMAQLVRAVVIRNRWDREVDRLVVTAMDAGESRREIANVIGKSREHLRTIRTRIESDDPAS